MIGLKGDILVLEKALGAKGTIAPLQRARAWGQLPPLSGTPSRTSFALCAKFFKLPSS